MCNQKIKFGVFHKHVMSSLGVDRLLVTTHNYRQMVMVSRECMPE